jgi:hypothetical protein
MGQMHSDLKNILHTEINKICTEMILRYDNLIITHPIWNFIFIVYTAKIKEVDEAMVYTFIRSVYPKMQISIGSNDNYELTINYFKNKLSILVNIHTQLQNIKNNNIKYIGDTWMNNIDVPNKIKLGKIIDYSNLFLSNTILTFEDLNTVNKRIDKLLQEVNMYLMKLYLEKTGVPKKLIQKVSIV